MSSYEEFREIIRTEREELTDLSNYWNSQIQSDKGISREVQGRIRAVVGKTRLLLAEKFKQFEGLVEQSENNTAEKEISINDLQGFWDLVLLQVNEIKEIFRDLQILSGKRHFSSDSRRNKDSSGTKKAPNEDAMEQNEETLKEIG